MSRPPRAFSYIRFSTPEQRHGDSLARQTRLAEAYCLKKGWMLDTKLTFEDLGVSGFRGQNVEDGKLGAFVKAIEDGVVLPGDRLVVENIDRLSRQTPRKALRTLEAIVEGGVSVVTLDDEKVYDEASLDDPMGLMWLVLKATRAHEESARKSDMLRRSWSSRRGRAKEKPVTSRTPGWLRLDTETRKICVIKERAAVVKRIYKMAAAGDSIKRITETLNREGVPVFGGGAFWYRFYISRVLDNPAVVGTWVPHTIDHGNGKDKKVRKALDPIPGCFPRVVDDETYERVRAMRETKSPAARGTGVKSLLAGIARCWACGGAMTRVAKAPPSDKRGGRPLLVCAKAKAGGGCAYKSVRQELVERSIINALPLFPWFDPDAESRIGGITMLVKAQDGVITNLVKQAAISPSQAISERLEKEETAKRESEREMEALLFQASPLVQQGIKKAMDRLTALVNQQPIDIPRANAIMRQLFREVRVDPMQGQARLEWRAVDDYERILLR